MPLFSWLQLAESLEITSNCVSSPQFSWFCFWLWLWSAGRPRDQFKLFCDGRPQITSTLIAPLYPQSWRNIFNNHINNHNTTLQCQSPNLTVFLSFDQSKVEIYPKNAKQFIQIAGHKTFTTMQLVKMMAMLKVIFAPKCYQRKANNVQSAVAQSSSGLSIRENKHFIRGRN